MILTGVAEVQAVGKSSLLCQMFAKIEDFTCLQRRNLLFVRELENDRVKEWFIRK